MRLLVATQNPGKKREFQLLLAELPIEVLFLDDIDNPSISFPEESGETFHENAAIKATFLAKITGIPTVADDSGLNVTALAGFPGVKSARWLAGSDQDRVNGLLSKLEGIDDRSAQFVCSICLSLPATNQQLFFDGFQDGSISQKPRGADGFAYDVIFIPKGQKMTYAELGIAYKNQHSHRAHALKKLASYVENYMID